MVDSYNKTKAKVKTSVIKTWSVHKKKVADIFNTLNTSETEVIPDDIIYNDDISPSSVTNNLSNDGDIILEETVNDIDTISDIHRMPPIRLKH